MRGTRKSRRKISNNSPLDLEVGLGEVFLLLLTATVLSTLRPLPPLQIKGKMSFESFERSRERVFLCNSSFARLDSLDFASWSSPEHPEAHWVPIVKNPCKFLVASESPFQLFSFLFTLFPNFQLSQNWILVPQSPAINPLKPLPKSTTTRCRSQNRTVTPRLPKICHRITSRKDKYRDQSLLNLKLLGEFLRCSSSFSVLISSPITEIES